MRVLVISETCFGNTATIAETITAELAPSHDVRMLAASDVDETEVGNSDLVIIGAPTHVHGLPSRRTRAAAVKQGGLPESAARAAGVRELLMRMSRARGGLAAAFDTRLSGPRLFTGAASLSIERRLRRLGYLCVVPPESFFVEGKEPVLLPGEVHHARGWARTVVEAAAASPRPHSAMPAAHA